MITHCLIHFGFPKTGTTSIQRFLRYELTDPGFHYPTFTTNRHLRDDCHNRALNCAFRSDPEKFHAHAKTGLSTEVIRRQGATFREQLQREIRSSPAHTLLLSAEDLSWFDAADIRMLVGFLTVLGMKVQALAFVRRFKRDQESRFQQSVRDPGWWELSKPRSPGFFPTRYQRAISNFDACLDRPDVLLHEYDRRKFENGCVVRQFCKMVGIRQLAIPSTFVNDSLSAEAINLLYAYRVHGPGYGEGWEALDANSRLVTKLSELKGSRLLFHSSLLTSKEDKWRADVEWAMERTGFDLIGNIYEDDDRPCVRGAEDMLRFSPESLDWLARAAHVKPSRLACADPKVVAATVHTLRKQLARPSLRGRLRNFVKRWF
jgi:hypothetical protein